MINAVLGMTVIIHSSITCILSAHRIKSHHQAYRFYATSTRKHQKGKYV